MEVSAFYEETRVKFSQLSEELLWDYIHSGEPMDKAGGYGIQALGGMLVEQVQGDFLNVVGFPLNRFCKQLAELFLQPPTPPPGDQPAIGPDPGLASGADPGLASGAVSSSESPGRGRGGHSGPRGRRRSSGASRLVDSLPPTPLLDLLDGFRAAKALLTACKMQVFDLLEDEAPLSAPEVARRIAASESGTARLLDACADLGLLEKAEGDRPSPHRARGLSKGSPLAPQSALSRPRQGGTQSVRPLRPASPARMDINMTRPDNATLQMLRNPAIAFVLPVVYSFVALVSIPGNGLSLWVLCRHIGPRSPSVIFMMNLSVTDLALASALPFQIHYHCHGHHWVFGPRLCTLVTLVFYANMYSSILTMACISVDRFLGVVHPLASARWRRRRYAVAACAGAWAALLAALAPLARADLTYAVRDLGIVTCFDVLQATLLPSVATWAAFLFTLFVGLFLLPFVVTVACYAATILSLLRSGAHGAHGAHGRRRAISLAAVVLVSFVTCFAPNNFVLLAHVVSRLFLGRSYYHVYKLTLCLSCLNNCLDPFVYYFASREFQLRLRSYWPGSPSPSSPSPQSPPLQSPPAAAAAAAAAAQGASHRSRQESARTLSAPSVSSCPEDGLETTVVATAQPFLQRQESVF